jgi:alkaline phosphatase
MRSLSVLLAGAIFVATGSLSHLNAQTIYPLGRADILAGTKFDFKVEFANSVKRSDVNITINGEPLAAVFQQPSEFIERENGKEGSSLILRDVSLVKPGAYKIVASDGKNSKSVEWTVFSTPEKPIAKMSFYLLETVLPWVREPPREYCQKVWRMESTTANSPWTTCHTWA